MKIVAILFYVCLLTNIYMGSNQHDNRGLKKVKFSRQFIQKRQKKQRQKVKKKQKILKMLPESPIFSKQLKQKLIPKQKNRQQKLNKIYNNYENNENILQQISKNSKKKIIKKLSLNSLQQILKTTLKKKKLMKKKLHNSKTNNKVTIRNAPFIKYMERKLEDDSAEGGITNLENIEKQIKETYILRNIDLEKPQLNYEYLNEDVQISNFTNVQSENYNPQESFDSIKIVNKKIHQCNFIAKKLEEKNLISIFDTKPELQKCNFYLAEQIQIMTNIYMFVIDKITNILPDHIIQNQQDYTKYQYLELMIKKDYPNMDYIIEYLQIADKNIIKRLVKNVPEEIIDYKQFFEDVQNFSDFREILKALNLTEARKLIIYFSNVIKYFQYIINYYNKNLHNKDGMEGNYYTRNIPKLIEVNDEFSSEEQKVFLQDSKDFFANKSNIDLQEQPEQFKKKFHVYQDTDLEELLDQYVQQCEQKEKQFRNFQSQQKSVAHVMVDAKRDEKNSKQTGEQISLDDFEVIHEPKKFLNEENMALLNTLPLNMIESKNNKNQQQKLSKREKKELKKLKKQQMKAEKQQKNMNQQNKNNKEQTQTKIGVNDQTFLEDQNQIQNQVNTQEQKTDQQPIMNNNLVNNRILQLN